MTNHRENDRGVSGARNLKRGLLVAGALALGLFGCASATPVERAQSDSASVRAVADLEDGPGLGGGGPGGCAATVGEPTFATWPAGTRTPADNKCELIMSLDDAKVVKIQQARVLPVEDVVGGDKNKNAGELVKGQCNVECSLDLSDAKNLKTKDPGLPGNPACQDSPGRGLPPNYCQTVLDQEGASILAQLQKGAGGAAYAPRTYLRSISVAMDDDCTSADAQAKAKTACKTGELPEGTAREQCFSVAPGSCVLPNMPVTFTRRDALEEL